ncbi:MAG: ABC transporter ATP-binding protein [Eggerthellaceae bacterium]|nr:ABC transporter ATP-binding protein [Eggerthellaceae bacterium]
MSLRVENVHLTLKGNHILKGVSFAVNDGELLSLLGVSGAGKSTLIRVICGLCDQDEGHVFINDECMDGVPAHKRGTIVVFQDIRLFPHMNVEENVAYPLRMRGVGKRERLERARELLELVQLDDLGSRGTNEISGGQAQRVALARALAGEPKVLLLDEPFSGLDEDLRDDMRTLLLDLHTRLGTTIVMVTHDAAEALMMSDRIVYIRDGLIVQDAVPTDLYEHPASLDVACCFGNCSTLSGEVENGVFSLGDLRVAVDVADGPATLVIRHDGIFPQVDSPLRVDVAQSIYRGNSHLVHLGIEGQTLVLQWPERIAEGQKVAVGIDESKAYCYPSE